jgi:hypothetical protein
LLPAHAWVPALQALAGRGAKALHPTFIVDPARDADARALGGTRYRPGYGCDAYALRLESETARDATALPDAEWAAGPITVAMKSTLTEFGLKMGQLAIPVRLLVFGQAQTPSVDAMLAAMPRGKVLERLANA